MTERGWFTLLVRGVGLWLAAIGLMRGVETASNYFVTYSQQQAFFFGSQPQTFWGGTATPTPVVREIVAVAIPSLIPMLVGLYLLFGGGWIVNRLCRSVIGCCQVCGYRVDSLDDLGRCPECGTQPRDTKPATTPNRDN